MGRIPNLEGRATAPSASAIRDKAIRALRDTDLSQVVDQLIETDTVEHHAATAALRAVLADNTADYLIKASKEAKKRGMRMGAAAIIIAAQMAKG